jgi:hypothetical protein
MMRLDWLFVKLFVVALAGTTCCVRCDSVVTVQQLVQRFNL